MPAPVALADAPRRTPPVASVDPAPLADAAACRKVRTGRRRSRARRPPTSGGCVMSSPSGWSPRSSRRYSSAFSSLGWPPSRFPRALRTAEVNPITNESRPGPGGRGRRGSRSLRALVRTHPGSSRPRSRLSVTPDEIGAAQRIPEGLPPVFYPQGPNVPGGKSGEPSARGLALGL